MARRTIDLGPLVSAFQNRIEGVFESRGSSRMIVALDGLGASGKSTVADELAVALDRSAVVRMDDFYCPTTMRPKPDKLAEFPVGSAFDRARLIREVITPFIAGLDAEVRIYDWDLDKVRSGWTVASHTQLLLLEGVYSSSLPLRQFLDLAVWFEVPRQSRLARAAQRDGHDALPQWLDEWMPQEDRYVLEQAPVQFADIVVDGQNFQLRQRS